MSRFAFDPIVLPPGIPAFRAEVRQFIGETLKGYPAEERVRSWTHFDAEFSRKLGERGWIGMVWPKKYGGHERSAIERYVLLEELLEAGAPVGAHWIADRQSGPAIIRYGTEEQREKFLPGIAQGKLFSCIGMSEPNTGSDLASVRTRATKVDGGWRLNGQKIWTTHAHKAHFMIALVRTSGEAESRHVGLSQFIIELGKAEGVRVRPIRDLSGDQHFNEVFFEDVFLPDDAMLGREGDGWKQVTSELSLERSGPERYLSSHQLFFELLRIAGPQPNEAVRLLIGRLTAEIWTLRQMSLSVAGQLARGEDPAVEASTVKDLGNSFEQRLPELVQAILDDGLSLQDAGAPLSRVLAILLQISPSFSLRGGTREILRGIIARGLGLR